MVIAAPVNTRAAWSARADNHPEPWAACGWSERGQRLRHQRVLWALDPQPGDSLLDWGCGTGELSEELPCDIEYVGFDSAAGMVTRASHDHPTRMFVDREPGLRRFDLVACVGCFNLPGGWTKHHTWHTIRHLWDSTGCRALAVSLYAGTDTNCLIYTEAETERRSRDLGIDVTVTRILPNDLLMVARR